MKFMHRFNPLFIAGDAFLQMTDEEINLEYALLWEEEGDEWSIFLV